MGKKPIATEVNRRYQSWRQAHIAGSLPQPTLCALAEAHTGSAQLTCPKGQAQRIHGNVLGRRACCGVAVTKEAPRRRRRRGCRMLDGHAVVRVVVLGASLRCPSCRCLGDHRGVIGVAKAGGAVVHVLWHLQRRTADAACRRICRPGEHQRSCRHGHGGQRACLPA